jgi:hypothetical protein
MSARVVPAAVKTQCNKICKCAVSELTFSIEMALILQAEVLINLVLGKYSSHQINSED